MKHRKKGIIELFTRHKVAANLFMGVLLLAGMFALLRLNIQFFPSFDLHRISVSTVWPGASAEDVERSITLPMERELRHVDDLKTITSTSSNNSSIIQLAFEQGTAMSQALEAVREKLSLIQDLPDDAKTPILTVLKPDEEIARLVISGPEDLQSLRPLIDKIEQELLYRGIAKIEVHGLPDDILAIEVPLERLAQLHLSLPQIANRLKQLSQDVPAGVIGRHELSRQLRSLEKRRSVQEFAQLPLVSSNAGVMLRLGDVAHIERQWEEDEPLVFYQGKPAVEMVLYRTQQASSFQSADILHQWLAEEAPKLPQNIKLHVYDESWQFIVERIHLLVKNGVGGLFLIILILLLFLHGRVAFWVAMGIPISFMAALAVLYGVGGSINMISLYAFIMTLGIIVDDTIVVGEEAFTQAQQGKSSLHAAEKGARKMLTPVLASSMTTLCAFIPLLMIGDVIGEILRAIPIVVICVILASLLECFLILPAHLYHSFRRFKRKYCWRQKKLGGYGKWFAHKRVILDEGFLVFREKYFRPLAMQAVQYRWVTVTLSLGLLIIVFGLLMGGRVNFNFFPSPEGTILHADVRFHAGTAEQRIKTFMRQVETASIAAEKSLSKVDNDLVKTRLVYLNYSRLEDSGRTSTANSSQYASLLLELKSPDKREASNQDFLKAWQKNITIPPEVESFKLEAQRYGPPGKDIFIELQGETPATLKAAAMALQKRLSQFEGVHNIQDNLPYGREQWIYKPNTQGLTLGLTSESIGQQIRAAYSGQIVQILHEASQEVEVQVLLPKKARNDLSSLKSLPILTPDGSIVPLESVVDFKPQQGFDWLRHSDARLTVTVEAQVNARLTNTNQLLAKLKTDFFPKLQQHYGVHIKLEGKAQEQRDTLRDMKQGLGLALALIYIVLAFVFKSYGLPAVVMLAIPFGLVGAVLGHGLLGMDLTILSLFGLFGLTGIVINDSIILLSTYKQLRREEKGHTDAIIVEAACRRLRAVLLTSLTTIAGLTPLLFESSLQAQFLIPMAVSICFGLGVATLLILLVIPAMLAIYENTRFFKVRNFRG